MLKPRLKKLLGCSCIALLTLKFAVLIEESCQFWEVGQDGLIDCDAAHVDRTKGPRLQRRYISTKPIDAGMA